MKHVTEVPALLRQLESLTGVDLSGVEETMVASYRQQENSRGSLIIRILSVMGGFLAMLFLLACLTVFGVFDTEASIITIGGILTIAGLIVAQQVKHLLVDTIAATAFMAGLVLISLGTTFAGTSVTLVCGMMVLVAGISLLITSNSVLAFLSALTATGCLLFVFPPVKGFIALSIIKGLLAWGYAWLITHEADAITRHSKVAALYRPVCLALTCTLLGGYFADWYHYPLYLLHSTALLIEPVMVVGALLFAAPPVLKRLGITNPSVTWKLLLVTAVLLVPALFVPGIPAALLVLMLSFGWRYPAGLVLGLAGLLYFICQYYYDLQMTLLMKAGLLFIPGILLIALYFVMHKIFQRDEKV